MIKIIFFFFTLINLSLANASTNIEIAKNFEKINSLKFNFIQKVDNNKSEKGECIVLYPKKIFCTYDDIYNKILVSNGKSLIINSDKIKNYFRYPLDKTPMNFILDKEFIISKNI
jgi:Outer membrane lipoprotein-sorting protein